jgi:hypothetical protein
MPDENRVFDVSKPNRVSPSATSRPVIVGHHPIMNDPMVKNEQISGGGSVQPTKIPITESGITVGEAMAAQPAPMDQGSPAVFSDPADEPEPQAAIVPEANHPESVAHGPFTEIDPPAAAEPQPELPKPAPHSEPHIEGLHFPAAKRRNPSKMIFAGILVLLVAAYLALDSGLVNAGVSMPFHIFKQKAKVATTAPAPAASQPVVTAPSLPAGFKEYKLASTNLTFAAPAAWGDPTSITDPGYSKRSTGAQSDGTYAYLVNFATNKNMQVAVTSSKYLPAARATQYYDYLQWCTGSSDGQIYESTLNFSTANKVDSPTTITCNQGPVVGAQKLDASTIVQPKALDAAKAVIGDIYTRNLTDPDLVVFRVKDAAMTSGTDIKQLLNTVKVAASQSSSSATP